MRMSLRVAGVGSRVTVIDEATGNPLQIRRHALMEPRDVGRQYRLVVCVRRAFEKHIEGRVTL
jgi:hypothetical protein